jgi:hypothetical protein
VAKKPRFDVVRTERFGEQRILLQVNLADRQVIGGLPVLLHQRQ